MKDPIKPTPLNEKPSASASRITGTKALLSISSDFVLTGLLALIISFLLVVDQAGSSAVIRGLRVILGISFVLTVPGYCMQAALFPARSELAQLDRWALSFGLSIAVLAPIAVVLDRLGLGIQLWPMFVSLVMVSVVCGGIASYRRWHMPTAERLWTSELLEMPQWWSKQARYDRYLYVACLFVVVSAGLATIWIRLASIGGEPMTEFYLVGPAGIADDFPMEAVQGQPMVATIGIANHEGVPAIFTVLIKTRGQTIGLSSIISLSDGEMLEQSVGFVMPTVGQDQPIDLILERQGYRSPYRTLRLWLNVTPAP